MVNCSVVQSIKRTMSRWSNFVVASHLSSISLVSWPFGYHASFREITALWDPVLLVQTWLFQNLSIVSVMKELS